MARHSWLGLAAAAMLAGCGSNGNDSSNPFPDVAGTYVVAGGFDGFTPDQASLTGSVTLEQPTREKSLLNGTATLTADIGGQTVTVSGAALQGAAVNPSGVVSFTLTSPGTGVTSWGFSGELAGTIFEGTHSLVRGGTTNTGTFTATETQQARAR